MKEQLKFLFRQLHKLLEIEEQLTLSLKDEKDMTDAEKALIAAFDAATDRIAARIQRLIDAGGLTTEMAAALQSEVDKLNKLGQDPVTPVPPGV